MTITSLSELLPASLSMALSSPCATTSSTRHSKLGNSCCADMLSDCGFPQSSPRLNPAGLFSSVDVCPLMVVVALAVEQVGLDGSSEAFDRLDELLALQEPAARCNERYLSACHGAVVTFRAAACVTSQRRSPAGFW